MAAPQTYTVTTVRADDKGRPLVVLEGVKEELGVWVPKNEQRPDIEAQTEIKGWINEGKDGGRYFRPATSGQGASQSAQNGAQSDGPDQAYWEAKDRRIQRQHSQDMALRVYELGRTDGVIDKAEDLDHFKKRIRTLADWLDGDVVQAGRPDDEIPFG